VQRPRPASHAHFRHEHIPELTCGFTNSIDVSLRAAVAAGRHRGRSGVWCRRLRRRHSRHQRRRPATVSSV